VRFSVNVSFPIGAAICNEHDDAAHPEVAVVTCVEPTGETDTLMFFVVVAT
jgi:hypothetical protein